MQRILDFHCHIYPAKIADKARANTKTFFGVESTECPGVPEDLIERCDRAGIEKCVVHSVATKPGQVPKINAFLSQTAAQYPDRFIPFGTVHQDCEDMEAVVDELCALGFKGIKLHPVIQGAALNDPRFMRLYEACRGRLMILFHAGDDRCIHSNPDQIVPVLQAFPDITFIGAHLGGYLVWDEAVQKLAGKFDNLYVDCSSSSFTMTRDRFRGYIEAFGTDRVVYGSDYPMWDTAKEVKVLTELGFSDRILSDIYWNNAARILNIE